MPLSEPTPVADLLAAGLVLPPRVSLPSPASLPSPPPTHSAPTHSAPTGNRSERRRMSSEARKLERQRRKFDKFVQPQGPAPRHIVRAQAPPPTPASPPSPADAVITPADKDAHDFHIVEVHHSDRQTDVIYDRDEFYGEFNFRDTILEQLDSYFIYLNRMKSDRCAYDFYQQVGAIILPYIGINDIWRNNKDDAKKEEEGDWDSTLSPWFLQTRPAFGCFAYGANPEVEKLENADPDKEGRKCWIPKFMYFQKYSQPPTMLHGRQRHWLFEPIVHGDFYEMTVWWDKPQDESNKRKHGVPNAYGIVVGDDGSVRALRLLQTKMLPIRSKKPQHRKYTDYVPHRDWGMPDDYEEWAKEHGTDAQKFLTDLFCSATARYERAAWSMVRVSVEKNGQYAMFNVDIHRMPYFFQDRDYSLTESGLRKRIFHMVRPHVNRDGTAIKMHFRGEREFTWAGYHVRITVPGKHYQLQTLEENTLAVINKEHLEAGEKYVKAAVTGRVVRALLNEEDTSEIRDIIRDGEEGGSDGSSS